MLALASASGVWEPSLCLSLLIDSIDNYFVLLTELSSKPMRASALLTLTASS